MRRAIGAICLFSFTFCLAAVEARAQNPRGSEIRVSSETIGEQMQPDVATAADGSFVVVWREGAQVPPSQEPVSVMARLFDAGGRPRGEAFLVARHQPTFWARPAVGMAANGSFVVVWNGGLEQVGFGRRFDANGNPLGPEFRLARNPDSGQEEPDVAVAPDGSFVAVWTQRVDGQFEVNTDVFFRRFARNGRPRGPEAVALGGNEEQSAPRVTFRPDGSLIVTGSDYNGEGEFFDIVARLFSRTGQPLGDQFQVNEGPITESSQYDPDVAAAADGRFAIAWTDRVADYERGDPDWTSDDDFTGVAVRFYAADGTPQGPTRLVNTYLLGRQESPAIAALPGGGFRMVWSSGGAQDGFGHGIYSQVFSADGEPLRPRERGINMLQVGNQYAPALAMARNGKGAIVWVSVVPDESGRTEIIARRLGRPTTGAGGE